MAGLPVISDASSVGHVADVASVGTVMVAGQKRKDAIMVVRTETSDAASRIPLFYLRVFVFLLMLAALLFNLITFLHRVERERRLREKQLRYAEEELHRARDELRDQLRGPQPDRSRSFWEADLEGSNLTGITIASDSNAFQYASFRKCRLEGATLQGGGASFQFARFDDANLTGVSLRGGVASFQASSFVGADLTGATLAGEESSFQGATFEHAILIGAKLSGNFQSVNFSGAKLEAADLSAIDRDNLASCYFKDPPTYDARTKSPPGFDPVEHLWRRVE